MRNGLRASGWLTGTREPRELGAGGGILGVAGPTGGAGCGEEFHGFSRLALQQSRFAQIEIALAQSSGIAARRREKRITRELGAEIAQNWRRPCSVRRRWGGRFVSRACVGQNPPDRNVERRLWQRARAREVVAGRREFAGQETKYAAF